VRSLLAVLTGLLVLTVTSFAFEWVADRLMFPHALPNMSALNSNLYAFLFMYSYTALRTVADA